MELKRAVVIGIVLWIVIFFEVCALLFGLKLQQGSDLYLIIHYILLSIFVLISSFIYLKDKKAKPGLRQGLLLGLTFVVIEIILDSIIAVPLFMKGDYGFLVSGEMVLSYLIGIFITSLVLKLKKIYK